CSVLFASVFFLNKRYKHLVFYSILCELFLVATYVIIFRAFGINIPSGEILLYVPLVLILTGLPVSIMGIGVREAVIASFFIAKADFNTLLFSALSVSFVESVLPLLLSMVFLKKFISSMSVSNKETESFDAETDFERRIKKVIDSMSKYFRKKDMNLRGVEVAKKAG
ncbi:MAG: flippase-like domain-containing protein, partial [Elusimicrobiales bacterium]|nr:flippase-like domain-containing protein [Elusimicrobiales bacterium]